ncbi:MAG: nuclear transport factor 2 family protein [Bradyrhizobium sp.]|nr:nuclear transport factor 2 family protein [Bradyrhizobium sp.]
MTQELIDRWYAAVRSGDATALASVVTEDVELLWNGDPARLPWAGSHRGIDAVLAFFLKLGEHIEVISVSPTYRLDAGEAVVVVLEGEWRVREQASTIRARACNVFRFREGRISSYEVYNDSGRFAEALNTPHKT